MTILSLRFNDGEIRLALRRNATAKAILNAVPFSATVQTWGQSIMFDCPLTVRPQESTTTREVLAGDIAFWADGSSIIIGFGKTPLSRSHEIRLAHACTVWADALDDVSQLATLSAGTEIHIAIAEPLDLSPASGQ